MKNILKKIFDRKKLQAGKINTVQSGFRLMFQITIGIMDLQWSLAVLVAFLLQLFLHSYKKLPEMKLPKSPTGCSFQNA